MRKMSSVLRAASLIYRFQGYRQIPIYPRGRRPSWTKSRHNAPSRLYDMCSKKGGRCKQRGKAMNCLEQCTHVEGLFDNNSVDI